ncbi:hypothetical protein KL86DES1_22144 [uncultured Desulfovibrio sp.]|uniref:Uncharacterized protein n=1 Tax=uncultured Desulfovibrio sp. TaxID=167968 RepID=A0A212LB97_9BACT|nr:hypothetical protein KL86DES1_22144 [uncultured Desulfovibrio sp.]
MVTSIETPVRARGGPSFIFARRGKGRVRFIFSFLRPALGPSLSGPWAVRFWHVPAGDYRITLDTHVSRLCAQLEQINFEMRSISKFSFSQKM